MLTPLAVLAILLLFIINKQDKYKIAKKIAKHNYKSMGYKYIWTWPKYLDLLPIDRHIVELNKYINNEWGKRGLPPEKLT